MFSITFIFEFIRQSYRAVKIEHQKTIDAIERADVAKAFNDIYTYRKLYNKQNGYLPYSTQEKDSNGQQQLSHVKKGYAWMCPQCNKIHEAIVFSPLTEVLYPTAEQSSLPPAEQIKQQRTVRIIRHVLVFKDSVIDNNFYCKALLHLDVSSDFWCERNAVTAKIYKINNDVVKGYIPSKMWFNRNNDIEMLFYVSDHLPERARPFAKQDMYVAVFEVDGDECIEYDIETTMFIDQLITSDHHVFYVIVFGQDQYDKIIKQEVLQ